MDWERPKINRNPKEVNQAERKERLLYYPERSCKQLQPRQTERRQSAKASKKSAEVIVGRIDNYRRTELVNIRSSP